MNKREQQRYARKEQILMCGLDMIISRGYEATTIRDIAKKLQISTGLFFNYFESKEKIYEELIKIGISGPKSVIHVLDEQASPIKGFEEMTETIFEALRNSSLTAKMFILMSQAINSESVPEGVKRVLSEFDAITPILAFIRKGQELGEIKAGNPVALALTYWGTIQGLAETLAVHPDFPFPESSWIVDIIRA